MGKGDDSEEESKRKSKATKKVKKSHIKPAPEDSSSGEEMDKEIIQSLAERNKDKRIKKKRILTSTESQVMSKEKKEKMVDQSTKVIRTASQRQVRQSCDDEEDQDDYFDEDIASLLRM